MTTSGRVLLADDSPHAQRMGERILREEGFEVVTVTDGETAIIRLKDVDPDIVIVDAFLPQVSGYDLCGFIKKQPQHSHVRVLLTSTALERVDEDQAYKAGADGQLKKPFEASVMLKSLKDLIGGSDKKKRGSTTSLDLTYSGDESSEERESSSTAAAGKDGAEEKPVSALQAWLQQHDTAAYGAAPDLEDSPAEPEPDPEPALAEVRQNTEASGVELSNPQLIRRVEEEPEDLSLRNNPVARLRYTPQPAPEIRMTPKSAESQTDTQKPASRGLRIEPTVRTPADELAHSVSPF
ncbi:MAG: response regulator [Bryobacterales bacterium]|nr:response regulator [Bryobacterales bacterium]